MDLRTEIVERANENNESDDQALLLHLKKQVAISIWIQTFGKLMESVNLTKLLLNNEESEFKTNEIQIVQGVWIQTFGQFIEAIGVTKEVLSNESNDLEGAIMANTGDWIQGVGAIYEAHTEKQIIIREREKQISELIIP